VPGPSTLRAFGSPDPFGGSATRSACSWSLPEPDRGRADPLRIREPAVAISQRRSDQRRELVDAQDRDMPAGPLGAVEGSSRLVSATVAVRVCLHPRPTGSGGSISSPVTIRCATCPAALARCVSLPNMTALLCTVAFVLNRQSKSPETAVSGDFALLGFRVERARPGGSRSPGPPAPGPPTAKSVPWGPYQAPKRGPVPVADLRPTRPSHWTQIRRPATAR
jgi:hypothetical protein